ncbi:MAG: YbaY family lipoprotein, partial [Anaerolineales bacterium]|nr:YbaY family lipoprotein [Anaerolineales bacterium]
SVDVIFSATNEMPPVESYIKITEPQNFTALDATQPIIINGVGKGLPEGNVNVQALDARGNVLTQESTTIQSPDAGTGGEGPWSVQLTFAAESGTPGYIRAFSTSPSDGSTIAEDSIEVTYIKQPTPQPFITITEPPSGAVLEIVNPITVKGTGAGLPEGSLVVQALDASGNILAQQPTTIQSPDAGTGGSGPWSVQLQVATQSGTTGSIRAFSTSPQDDSLIAEARIQVTFGKTPEIQPYITISEPIVGAVLDISNPITVKGMGRALPEGNLIVTALDSGGNVLAEQSTTIQSPDAGTGGEGPWSVQLTVSATPGTPGSIRAYSTSPADGSTVAEAIVQVTYGQTPAVQPFITITQPTSGTVLDIANPFTVNGMAGGLFEGNIVVQALDGNGNVLDEQATTIQSPDAGIGGQGSWETQLSVSVEPGANGRIYAFSTSPQDGSTDASASVDVIYGQEQIPEEEVLLEEHLWLLQSYGTNTVLEDTYITAKFKDNQVSGSAGCNTYSGAYERTTTDLTVGSLNITQMSCSTPEGSMEQETQYFTLLQSSAFFNIDQKLSIMNQANEKTLVYDAAVIGTIITTGEAALPENSVVQVTLSDVSLADAAAIVIGEQIINNPSGFPIPFQVTYNPEVIDQRFTYAIGVRITDESGTLLYINTSAYNVITQGNQSVVEVTVDSVE